MCNSIIKKVNTYVVVSHIWQSERMLSMTLRSSHYLIKRNFTFCFQLRYLRSISLVVMVKGFLHYFSFSF